MQNFTIFKLLKSIANPSMKTIHYQQIYNVNDDLSYIMHTYTTILPYR